MGNTLTKGTLFPVEQTNEMISLVKGKSSLAKLSASEPVPFNGKEIFTFTLDKEVDLVAENGAKSNGGATVAPVQIMALQRKQPEVLTSWLFMVLIPGPAAQPSPSAQNTLRPRSIR